MTVTASPAARRTGRWIDDWHPEDPEFWESTGAPVARRNLTWSILAEHLGFSVWLFWSVSAALLAKNLVNRVAHLKQLRGEHQWVVTPRTAASSGSSADRTDDPQDKEAAA